MRWIFLLLAVIGFAFAFSARSPGALGFGLVLGFGGLLGALFGFAAARIAANAQPDSALLTDKDIAALRASMRKPPAAGTPPSNSA